MKWRLLLAGSLAAALAGIFIFWQRPLRAVPGAFGNLSKKDAAEIRQAIRREMWRRAFPDVTWRTFKKAPKSLWQIATTRIQEIHASPDGFAKVTVASHSGEIIYLLQSPNSRGGGPDWRVVGGFSRSPMGYTSSALPPFGLAPATGIGQIPDVVISSPYRGPIWFGAYTFSSSPESGIGPTAAAERILNELLEETPRARTGAARRTVISTETQFERSLSNRANLGFDR